MRFTNPLGPTVLAPTSEVTLAAGTKVVLATGSVVSLAAGAKVAVTGASAAGQTVPAFAGRTVSAGSTVQASAGTGTIITLAPVPALTDHLELHNIMLTAETTSLVVTFSQAFTPFATGVFCQLRASSTLPPVVFSFQGATLLANRGVWLKRTSGTGKGVVQLNYTVRS